LSQFGRGHLNAKEERRHCRQVDILIKKCNLACLAKGKKDEKQK
jgi:hypothetical protein